MHLERRSSPGKAVCYPDQLAVLRSNAFGGHPTLGICWGEPPDSNLILDILCDRANKVLIGKGSKNVHPRVQILHVVYETPLPCPLSATGASRFMRQCVQNPFRHNLCGVHSDTYPEIVRELLGQRSGYIRIADEDHDGITLFFPMETGDQPRLFLFDMDHCPDIRIEGK
ncbi:MAG: hypothetical protein WC551_05005 [Patescibacteria group bacterium]